MKNPSSDRPDLPRALSARLDGVDKVTGRAVYAADVRRPGVLQAKVVRSPYPHAQIRSIEIAAAQALPGVRSVLIGADIPTGVRVGRAMRDMPVLASSRVRFIGEKVAAVAAETEEIAEQAAALIQVEYAEIPAVFEPLEAIQLGAPRVHESADVRAHLAARQVMAEYPNSVSLPTWGCQLNELEAAFASADFLTEHTFRTPRQHQAFLEPHAATVDVDAAGVAHIWATNKAPSLLTDYLSAGLGLAREQVDIHILPLGGDFGGKGSFMDIPLLYFLSRATGRPVRMAMSYVEELTAGNPRHAATTLVKSGVRRDGRIVAQLMRVYFNSGAYAAFKPALDATLPGIAAGAFGPYAIGSHRVEAHMVYTNTVPCGHMRGPGEAQTAYALECHLELTARELGFDPVEFRLLNVKDHPRPLRDGSEGPRPRAHAVLRTAAERIGWLAPRPANVGRGLALLEYATFPGIYSGAMDIARDGQVTLRTAIVENGVGSHSAFREIVAQALDITPELIEVVATTEGVGYDRGVGGARVTRLLGIVFEALAETLQARLRALIAGEFGGDVEQVAVVPGGFRDSEGRFFTFTQAAALAPAALSEQLTYHATERDNGVVYLGEAAEIHLDPETGQITPLRLVSVHEVGRIIRPDLHQGQIEGGLAQGLGFALMEGLLVQDGRVVTPNLNDYKIPTQMDMPPLETVLLAHDQQLGITPIGEGPGSGIAPALTNALVDILGPRALDLPLNPELLASWFTERDPEFPGFHPGAR